MSIHRFALSSRNVFGKRLASNYPGAVGVPSSRGGRTRRCRGEACGSRGARGAGGPVAGQTRRREAGHLLRLEHRKIKPHTRRSHQDRHAHRQWADLGAPRGSYYRLTSLTVQRHDEQDVTIQIEQLTALGVDPDRIYIDRGFSGTRRDHRAGLDQALAAVWPGSVLTVTKFDRFARDVADAHTILTDLANRGVRFGLGGSVYDWNDPFGRL